MLNGYYSKFVGICISTSRLYEDVDAIALGQREALSNAFRKHEQGDTLDDIISQYHTSLRQFFVVLHSLGYPVISFYIDHPLSTKVSNHPHTSLMGTMHSLTFISRRLKQSCLQNRSSNNASICGSAHMHNLRNLHSMQSVEHRYTLIIKVPHMFYVNAQFLEIILVGGFMPNECLGFQSFTVWRNTIFPFTTTTYRKYVWNIYFAAHIIHLQPYFLAMLC